MAGTASRAANCASWTRRLSRKGLIPTKRASGRLLTSGGEGGIDLRASAGIDDLHRQSDGADSRFQFFQCGLRSPGISRIDEHGNTNDSR